MPRPAKPPRLYLRERRGRDSVFVILDRGKEIGTGCGPDRQREAEEAFARYLAGKHVPSFGDGDPAKVLVADILTLYATERAPKVTSPATISYRIDRLLEFFGEMMAWDVSESTCGAYVDHRMKGSDERRPVSSETARAELQCLGAALAYAYRARKIHKPVFVSLPEKSAAKERWLTRSEAARLIAGALGFSPVKIDRSGRVKKWKRVGAPSYHVARFILIALYTATRHEAVLTMRWGVNSSSGWFDLDRGILYRRGTGQRDTAKRRTPAPIPDKLMPHLKRWRKMTHTGPCEYEDRLTQRQKTGFNRARDLAKLGSDVTPHTLKHTSITWLLQDGVPIWEVAGFSGTSEETIRNTYGHHAPDHMPKAKRAFRGRILGGK